MVLNWKIWDHYKKNKHLAEVYDRLWEDLDNWIFDNKNDDEIHYYIMVTD